MEATSMQRGEQGTYWPDAAQPSEYEVAYEAELGQLLHDYVAQNEAAGEEARQAFAAKITKGSGNGSAGPYQYAVGWGADTVIEAETRAWVATQAKYGLARTDMRPSVVLAHLRDALQGLEHAALDGGRSTSPWQNLCVAEQGRAAHKLLRNDWYGLGAMAGKADWATREQLAKDEHEMVRARKAQHAEVMGMRNRARSDERKQELQAQADAMQATIRAAEAAVTARLVQAGVPAAKA